MSASRDPLVLRLSFAPHAGHAPAFLALAAGHFAAEGLEVTIQPGQGSVHSVQAVGEGQADLATVDSFAAVGGWLRGVAIVSLFVELHSSLLGLVVRTDANIDRPADLRGHRVGLMPLSTTALATRAVLGRLGLSEGDVDLIEVPPGGDMKAMLDGEIDAQVTALTNEAVLWRLRYPRLRFRAWPLTELGIDVYGHVTIAARGLAARRPELLPRYKRAMFRAWEAALADPDAAVAAMVEVHPHLDRTLEKAKFAAVVPLARPREREPFGHQTGERWAAQADILVRFGGFPTRPNPETFIYDLTSAPIGLVAY